MLVLLNGLQAGNRSGTGRYTIELARWLPELAHNLDFAILWPKDVPHPQRRRDAFLLRRVGGPFRRIYLDQIALRAEQKRLRANIVHYPANIGNLGDIHNQVITVHDLSFLHNPRWFRFGRARYYSYAVRPGLRQAKRVIVDSEATKADVCEWAGAPQDGVDVIPLGVGEDLQPAPDETQARIRAKYNLPKSFFLFLGTIEPRKNILRLVQAWSQIAEGCPYDLVVAGRAGWKTRPILRAMAQAPHARRIHGLGFVDEADLPALLSSATVFVWPSLCEGFGLPPLEAMACGTPVLTANASSLPETVGDAALQVDPTDVDAIAHGMQRLANDANLRAALVAKGLERAATFTWRRTAERTIETYYKVLNL